MGSCHPRDITLADDTMDSLKPHETCLTGKRILKGNQVDGDDVHHRIEWLVESVLQRLAFSPETGVWETLFTDPNDGRLWERTYPESGLHGGGPPQLSVIDAASAERKYRWRVQSSNDGR